MWRCPEPSQRVPDARGVSPPPAADGRKPAGHRDLCGPGPPPRPGPAARVRTGASDLPRTGLWKPGPASPPCQYRAWAMSATEALLEMGDGNEHQQTGSGEHGICPQAAQGKQPEFAASVELAVS